MFLTFEELILKSKKKHIEKHIEKKHIEKNFYKLIKKKEMILFFEWWKIYICFRTNIKKSVLR